MVQSGFSALLFLGTCDLAASFVVPMPTELRSSAAPSCRCRQLSTAGVKIPIMMAGFGESKPERPKPKVVGAGRGQKVYRQQVKSFVGLRKAGAEFVDVYATEAESKDNRFIFAGKVAWSSGITVEQALQWHRDLIVDHVKLLEPAMKPPLKIFIAPGDSEVEVARNVHDLTWALGGKGRVDVSGITNPEVGYKPELYDKGENYFYVTKLPDGKCPQPPAEIMIESMDKIAEAGVVLPPSTAASPPPI